MPTDPVEIVYIVGRSGRGASTWCKDLDALALFAPTMAPGDYWIRRAVVPKGQGGYRTPTDVLDWGVLCVDADGGFAIASPAGSAEADRARERDFRAAHRNSTLPGPGRDG